MKPIIVGSCAFSLGKRAEESKSHEWVVYVRAQDPEEDLSQYIKKVVFQLHQSFKPATRGAHVSCRPTPPHERLSAPSVANPLPCLPLLSLSLLLSHSL